MQFFGLSRMRDGDEKKDEVYHTSLQRWWLQVAEWGAQFCGCNWKRHLLKVLICYSSALNHLIQIRLQPSKSCYGGAVEARLIASSLIHRSLASKACNLVKERRVHLFSRMLTRASMDDNRRSMPRFLILTRVASLMAFNAPWPAIQKNAVYLSSNMLALTG